MVNQTTKSYRFTIYNICSDNNTEPSSPQPSSSAHQFDISSLSIRLDQQSQNLKDYQDHLIGIGGPMTYSRVRQMNEALTQLLIDVHEENKSKLYELSTQFVHILARQSNIITTDGQVLSQVDYLAKSTARHSPSPITPPSRLLGLVHPRVLSQVDYPNYFLKWTTRPSPSPITLLS